MSTLKPLADEAIIEAAGRTKGIVTAEEHSVIGGLGSVVSQALRGDGRPVEIVGITDKFGCSAHGYEELLEYYGLTSGAIEKSIKRVFKGKDE